MTGDETSTGDETGTGDETSTGDETGTGDEAGTEGDPVTGLGSPPSDARDDPRWSVRAATVDDATRIGSFHCASWREAYVGIVPEAVLERMGIAERTLRWRRRLTEGRRSTVFAELVDRPPTGIPPAGTSAPNDPARAVVGLASWGPSHDPPEYGLPSLELASLYVARAQWGSGLAAMLMQRAIGDAPAHLWVYAANRRARAFYEKHGFNPDGREQVDEATGVLECRYVRS